MSAETKAAFTQMRADAKAETDLVTAIGGVIDKLLAKISEEDVTLEEIQEFGAELKTNRDGLAADIVKGTQGDPAA